VQTQAPYDEPFSSQICAPVRPSAQEQAIDIPGTQASPPRLRRESPQPPRHTTPTMAPSSAEVASRAPHRRPSHLLLPSRSLDSIMFHPTIPHWDIRVYCGGHSLVLAQE
jgi:hypothetical protein